LLIKAAFYIIFSRKPATKIKETAMVQFGFLDFDKRLQRIDQKGDPLNKISASINWELFRPILESTRKKERKSNAGAIGYDVVLLFKMLILQSLYNLSDEAMEYQVLDRYSFSRFLGLHAASKVPDATTLWRFRESLSQAGVVEKLFQRFDELLGEAGLTAQKGQIIDAAIIRAPIQRNSRDQNKLIKSGEVPEEWSASKKCQKDTDARWTKKNGKSFFGYKNHVAVDVKHKLIRSYEVTPAAVHDSKVFEGLLDPKNTSRDVWADAAYRSEERIRQLREAGYRAHLQRKGCRHRKLTELEKQGNRTRAKIRARVEHVFGVQAKKAGDLVIRTIGIVRAKAKIGLRNLAYNLDRYGMLVAT
jgi:transposase, IS5 family